jgi:uncharacterized damage-inducible protein DinB
MKLTQAFLAEFDQEMVNTRKTLERVPDGKFDWKPHEKSMPMGRLASHIATLPSWAVETIKRDSLDIAPEGGEPYKMPEGNTTKEVLDLFDQSVRAARAAIAEASDEDWAKPWSLLRTGQTILTLPRAAVLRSFVMSHGVHHRAQLGVYLRLNDLPLPAIYGPSADESGM